MNDKIELIEKLLIEEKIDSLVLLRERILEIDNNILDKEFSFGLYEFLENFFNKKLNNGREKIDFKLIEFEDDNFLLNVFRNSISNTKEKEQFDIYTLREHDNFSFISHEPIYNIDDIYGKAINDVLFAVKEKSNYTTKIKKSNYPPSLNTFRFGKIVINQISPAHRNFPLMVGINWFLNDLIDYSINLEDSNEYFIDYTKLDMLNDIFKILTKVKEKNTSIEFITDYTGYITIIIKKNKNIIYLIKTRNIDELHKILKNTEQNEFIEFLLRNDLNFSYEFNRLYCCKNNKKRIFKIEDICIENVNPFRMNHIMKNIDLELNILDKIYFGFYEFFNSKEVINSKFNDFNEQNQLKLFKYIFDSNKSE